MLACQPKKLKGNTTVPESMVSDLTTQLTGREREKIRWDLMILTGSFNSWETSLLGAIVNSSVGMEFLIPDFSLGSPWQARRGRRDKLCLVPEASGHSNREVPHNVYVIRSCFRDYTNAMTQRSRRTLQKRSCPSWMSRPQVQETGRCMTKKATRANTENRMPCPGNHELFEATLPWVSR